MKEQGKAFWPQLSDVKTDVRGVGGQAMETETEDQGLVNNKNEEEKAREIEGVVVKEVVKDRSSYEGEKSPQVLECVVKEENRCTDKENLAMEEGELKEHSGDKSVEDTMEQEDLGNEEEQERNGKKALKVEVIEMNQKVEKVASRNGGEEDLMENLNVDKTRSKRCKAGAEYELKSHEPDEDKCVKDIEPDAKKRKVIIGDKKLLKKQAKKAKGDKRRVRQRRAKQLRMSFFSSQGNMHPLQSGWKITEQDTGVALKELKSEVLVIGQSTIEINRKLQISLLNQVIP